MLNNEFTKTIKKRYEPPMLLILGEVDRGEGISCAVGTIPVITCFAGSIDGGTECTAGGAAVLGKCTNGPSNPIPY